MVVSPDRGQVSVPSEGFKLVIDGKEYEVKSELLTGREIMKLGDIPIEDGLIQLLPDGTQVQIGPDQVVDLKQGDHYKRPPRFNRGMLA